MGHVQQSPKEEAEELARVQQYFENIEGQLRQHSEMTSIQVAEVEQELARRKEGLARAEGEGVLLMNIL